FEINCKTGRVKSRIKPAAEDRETILGGRLYVFFYLVEFWHNISWLKGSILWKLENPSDFPTIFSGG
ncbi:MAG: hypothetical protein ACYC38_13650, partial [Eubacteriales bacterium]